MISRAKRNLFIKTEKRLANCVITRPPFALYPVFRRVIYVYFTRFHSNIVRNELLTIFFLPRYNFKWEVIHRVWELFHFFHFYFPRERSVFLSHSFQVHFIDYCLFCWNINRYIYIFYIFYIFEILFKLIMEKYFFREKKIKMKRNRMKLSKR